jgi:hypothetical protein
MLNVVLLPFFSNYFFLYNTNGLKLYHTKYKKALNVTKNKLWNVLLTLCNSDFWQF